MAKRSLNIDDKLDKKIKEYADKGKITFTAACNELLGQSFDSLGASDDLKSQIEALKTQVEGLKSEKESLKMALDKEKEEKMLEYKNTIEKSTQTTQALIDLMKAEKILQVGKKVEKPGFFGRIKALFSGKNKEYNDNI